jgi:hypothetical protein
MLHPRAKHKHRSGRKAATSVIPENPYEPFTNAAEYRFVNTTIRNHIPNNAMDDLLEIFASEGSSIQVSSHDNLFKLLDGASNLAVSHKLFDENMVSC